MTATDRSPGSCRPGRDRANDVDELIVRWQRDGDQAAREQLVVRFMPMVRNLANRYRTANESNEDLVQVASLGLLGAIDRFDPSRGTAFSSFAVPTILGEIKRHFRNTGWSVHVPRGAQEMALRVDQAITQLTAEHGRTPNVDAIAKHLHISIETALEGLEASSAHFATSLDAPTQDDDTRDPVSLGELLGAEDDRLALVEMSASLSAAFDRLPYSERRALALRVQHDMTQTEIARVMGCSQMHVSRLLRRAASTLHALTARAQALEPPGRRENHR